MKPLHTETNAETQMQSRVYVYERGGFTVTLVDLDSGNTLPTMGRFATFEAAVELAKKWAHG